MFAFCQWLNHDKGLTLKAYIVQLQFLADKGQAHTHVVRGRLLLRPRYAVQLRPMQVLCFQNSLCYQAEMWRGISSNDRGPA